MSHNLHNVKLSDLPREVKLATLEELLEFKGHVSSVSGWLVSPFREPIERELQYRHLRDNVGAGRPSESWLSS